jgi:phosphatidylglycerol:prolipoprotein diacylglycerol transferase
LSLHDLVGMGFTWYGGLVGGVVAALVIVRRHQLPLGVVAGAAAVPLTVAYGIGRLGCLLAGDGTYGKPTSVPWAMTFPNGVVRTNVPALLGLTQPQLWALVSVIAGVVLAHTRHRNPPRRAAGRAPRDEAMTVRPSA